MLKITQKKKEYYDVQMSGKYVELIESFETKAEDTLQYTTDCDTQVIDAIIVGPDLICDIDGVVISSRWKKKKTTIRLSEEACVEINKCINDLFRYFKGFVSLDLLQRSVYDWIYKAYAKETEDTLCTYIENEIDRHTCSFMYIFPLPYLEFQNDIQIGEVHLGRMKQDDVLNELFSKIADNEIAAKSTATIILEGEIEAKKEKAREIVEFAIDILKICSSLKLRADSHVYNFDINYIPNASSGTCYVFEPKKDELQKEWTQSYMPFKFDNDEIALLSKNNALSQMEKLMAECDVSDNNRNSETDNFIIRSIRLFSTALSTKNSYEKVVKLCSILDAAVLKNSEVGIKESLKKYMPILVTEDLKKRESVQETIEKMYGIRSDYIHRGKEGKIEVEDIVEMNLMVFFTIMRFLQLRTTYKTPEMLLDTIDKLQLSVHL